MIIAGRYSFNGGDAFIQAHYPYLLAEIEDIIAAVDATAFKIKVSKEKSTQSQLFYAPTSLNRAFKAEFTKRHWVNKRQICVYPQNFYTAAYQPRPVVKRTGRPYRDMDFLKEQLGVEVQFGKYAFMVYNVAAKMTIFHNLHHIDAGVEIVPIGQFAAEMSSGVSYFEQFVWDLEQRGTADIDIPVLVLGVDVEGSQSLVTLQPDKVIVHNEDESIEESATDEQESAADGVGT